MNLAELAALLRETTPVAEAQPFADEADDLEVFRAVGALTQGATVRRTASGRIAAIEQEETE